MTAYREVVTSSPGETWGISGPTFLVLYPLLGFTLLWALSRLLTPYRHGPTTWMGTTRSLTPVEWGMLSRDDGAVTAALAELLADGWLQVHGDRVVATRQGSGTLATPMHGAVLLAVRERDGRVTMDEIRRHPAVQRELVALRGLLEGRGLIATRRQQRGWDLYYAGLVAWFALGAVRLVVGLRRGRPVGYLVAELITFAVVLALVLAFRRDRMTKVGAEALNDAVKLNRDLAVRMPSRRQRTAPRPPAPRDLGLAVGLFGTAALFVAAPAFAETIALPKQVYGSVASDGSGGGDSGGSGSSCGGGCGGGCGG